MSDVLNLLQKLFNLKVIYMVPMIRIAYFG